MKKFGIYEVSIILFFLIVPIAGIIIECMATGNNDIISIGLKWFVFSGIGLRLGSAGIKQILQPAFTGKEIFHVSDDKALAIIKELGFANICLAIIAILSMFFETFRIPAAVAGGLYFGLAGFQHIIRKRDSSNETNAMISAIFIFIVLLVLLLI